MDTALLSAVIGGVATVVAAVIGGLVGRSDFWDRMLSRSPFPRLVGTRWESSWIDMEESGPHAYKETFEFTAQKRGNVSGHITMDSRPDLKWDIWGDYNDRFLRLFWTPSKNSHNKFFLDYGCYFFERQGDGSFKGYAIGFDSVSNKIETSEHIMRQIPAMQ